MSKMKRRRRPKCIQVKMHHPSCIYPKIKHPRTKKRLEEVFRLQEKKKKK